jgi:glycosyltransferase involved in cell wall biosynthesis
MTSIEHRPAVHDPAVARSGLAGARVRAGEPHADDAGPRAEGGAPRMKVLISAYACGPHRGSEPGVGWNWVLETAREHDVWVVTSRESEAAIAEYVAAHPSPNIRWTFHDLGRWLEPSLQSLVWRHLHYYLWQLSVYAVAKRMHRAVGFHVLHHVTIAMYWRPSLLALLPVPFVWGPVGGGDAAPKALRGTLSGRGWLHEIARAVAQAASEYDPLVRLTARRAALALAATVETADRIGRLGARNVELMESVGLTDAELAYLGGFPLRSGAPFRVLSVGNLLGLKGFHLGIAAFARLQRVDPTSEYWIVGDGPERRRLERLARSLNVDGKVRFVGRVPRARVFEILQECDVLMHPSLHDSGGFASLEAMTAGRPVVCLDIGGPGMQVTDATGIKVAPGSPEQVEDALARALVRLCTDAELRRRMAAAGRERVARQYRWRHKAEALSEWLRRHLTVGGRAARGGRFRDAA